MDVFQEAEMLRKVPFFGGLDAAKLKLLAFTSRAVRFEPGQTREVELVELAGDRKVFGFQGKVMGKL